MKHGYNILAFLLSPKKRGNKLQLHSSERFAECFAKTL